MTLDPRLTASGSLKAIHKKGKKANLEDKGREAKMAVRAKNRGKPEMVKDREDPKLRMTIR